MLVFFYASDAHSAHAAAHQSLQRNFLVSQ